MSTGFVAIKGSEKDIKAFENLILRINTICREVGPPGCNDSAKAERLMECLHDDSEENKLLNTFLTHIISSEAYGDSNDEYDCLWGFADHSFYYDSVERELNIGGHLLGSFPTEEWAYILCETFPMLSFFLSGDYLNDYIRGHHWIIYKDGVYVSSEDHFYDVEGLEYPGTEENEDDNEYASDCWPENLLDDLGEYTLALANAELIVWQLSDREESLLNEAKDRAKSARQNLETILSRAGL
jgi:hypothetical protein